MKKWLLISVFMFVAVLNGFSLLLGDKLWDLVERVHISKPVFTAYIVAEFVCIALMLVLMAVLIFKKDKVQEVADKDKSAELPLPLPPVMDKKPDFELRKEGVEVKDKYDATLTVFPKDESKVEPPKPVEPPIFSDRYQQPKQGDYAPESEQYYQDNVNQVPTGFYDEYGNWIENNDGGGF